MQNAPVNRLESVAKVWDRSRDDDAHGVSQIRRGHFALYGDVLYHECRMVGGVSRAVCLLDWRIGQLTARMSKIPNTWYRIAELVTTSVNRSISFFADDLQGISRAARLELKGDFRLTAAVDCSFERNCTDCLQPGRSWLLPLISTVRTCRTSYDQDKSPIFASSPHSKRFHSGQARLPAVNLRDRKVREARSEWDVVIKVRHVHCRLIYPPALFATIFIVAPSAAVVPA